jgi:pSer/pThr/pTyr-binding forkhead associated (FHA) protein
MLKLLHTKNDAVLNEFTLDEGVTSIGRGPGNNIRLEDMAVSAHHAEIRVLPNRYLKTLKDIEMQDLNSTNGTLVNGKKAENGRLKHGDVIQIGPHQFKLVNDDDLPPDVTRIYLPDADET